MSEDIRINVDFFTHHKTRRLKRRLGTDAVLSLITLFCYVGKNRPEGALLGLDADDIADVAGWDGDAQEFVSELCGIGFLEQCEEGIYHIHEWDEHNPWAADQTERSEKSKKAANKRWEKVRASKAKEQAEQASSNAHDNNELCSNDANAMLEQCPSNANAMLTQCPSAPLPLPEENSLSYAPARVDEQPKPDLARGPSLDFEELRHRYDEVGRQEGPLDGYAEFLALKKSGELVGNALTLMDAVDVWAASGEWNGDYVGQFAPKLSKFLASGQWKRKPKARAPVPKVANGKATTDTTDGNDEAIRVIERTRALCESQRTPEEQTEINRRNIAKIKAKFRNKDAKAMALAS